MPAANSAPDFWRRVDQSGDCWVWTGTSLDAGYGRIGWRGEKVIASRLAYELTVGPIPDGMWVLHRCDNPPCVNPEHLFLGTRQDNIDDMVAKGRQRSGGHATAADRNARAKLTWEKVREIRRRYIPRRVSLARLAREFGVSPDTVHAVVRGDSWRDSDDDIQPLDPRLEELT